MDSKPKPKKKVKKEVDDTPRQVGGVYIFPNGDRYEGDVIKRNDGTLERSGTGTHESTTGIVYTGEWAGDVMSGNGRLTHPSGCDGGDLRLVGERHTIDPDPDDMTSSVYEGQFMNNKFHGTGKYFWPDGSFYEGSFVDNKLEGQGQFTDIHTQQWHGEFMYKAAPGLRFKLNLE